MRWFLLAAFVGAGCMPGAFGLPPLERETDVDGGGVSDEMDRRDAATEAREDDGQAPGASDGGAPSEKRPADAVASDARLAARPSLPSAMLTGDEVPTVMMVGYGGIRVVSQDDGITWQKVAELAPAGGDDGNLLRGVAWGNGTWVVSGWRVFTSPDGHDWTERVLPPGCAVLEGLAFGNGTFVGACDHRTFLSDDGVEWRQGGSLDVGGHTYLLFAEGRFAASGDSGASFTSKDGLTWTPLSGIDAVTVCDDRLHSRSACPAAFSVNTTALRDRYPDAIERSTDGSSWSTVYIDPSRNTGYRFGLGMMRPLP